MSYDAIVVGAGISGAATAYHLRKAGAKTLLLERGEPASGGTGKSAAIIRQSYSTPLLVRLARASITMFENAKTELGKDAGFVQAGYCFVVSQDMLEGAKKNVAMQKGPRHRERMVGRAGLSRAPARTQSRRRCRHRLRAAWRLRRSRAGDRGLCGGVQERRRRIPRTHAGAAVVAAARPHHGCRARQWRGERRRRGQCGRPVGKAAGGERGPRAADALGARTGHGVADTGGPQNSENLDLHGRRCDLLSPARPGPLHHRARLPEGICTTSIPTISKPAADARFHHAMCRPASSAAFRLSPA